MPEANLPEMQEQGLVREVQGGLAVVESVQSEACAGCAAKGACRTMGGGKVRLISALNQAGAKEGDRVVLALPRRGALGAGFLVYILPVLALMLGALAGQRLGPAWGFDSTNSAVVLGLGSLSACGLFLRWLSKRLAGRREFLVKVVRVLPKEEYHEKEECHEME